MSLDVDASDVMIADYVSQLEQFHCYQTGLIHFQIDNNDGEPRSFERTSSFLPYTVDHVHYLTCKNDNSPEPDKGISPLREILRQFGKPIHEKHSPYDKPVAVIYNPKSGSRANVKQRILFFLSEHSIQATFFETKHHLHAWELAEETVDLEAYSAIVAVGGDGTFHEVVNGLMNRNDGLKVPIAFVPNGTGNDTIKNFGITTLEEALEVIVKGQVIDVDCNLVTLDAEDPGACSGVTAGWKRNHVRYSIANSASGFIAQVVHKAAGLKEYLGGIAYPLTGLKELLLHSGETATLELQMEQPGEGSMVTISNLQAMFLFVNNGKFAGGHACYCPLAMLNDGLLDVVYMEGTPPFLTALRILHQVSTGVHVFRNDIHYYRAKSIKIITRHRSGENTKEQVTSATAPEKEEQHNMYQVDGECLAFFDYVRVEAIPGALQVIVDYDRIMPCSKLSDLKSWISTSN